MFANVDNERSCVQGSIVVFVAYQDLMNESTILSRSRTSHTCWVECAMRRKRGIYLHELDFHNGCFRQCTYICSSFLFCFLTLVANTYTCSYIVAF